MYSSRCPLNFDSKRKDMTVRGYLLRSGFVGGEQIKFSLEIINPRCLAIRRISICLVQRYEIDNCRRRLELSRHIIPEVCDTDDKHVRAMCSLAIPQGIPPSYQLTTTNHRSRVNIRVYYVLKIEVATRGLFTDFDLHVPIIIATDALEGTDDTQRTNQSLPPNMIDTDQYENNDDEDLPSYESIFSQERTSNSYENESQ
jgi:hypothetical protein